MGAGRVIVGLLFCIATVCLIVIFVTLGLDVNTVVSMGWGGSADLLRVVFLMAPHSYSFLIAGSWSLLAALAAGAFIGGLIAKGAKGGLAVGSISFGIIMLLQIGIGVLFNFSDLAVWYVFIESVGGNIFIDFALTAGILIVCGVIGGALTGGE